MNYQKIYDQLVQKRQLNRLSKEECYCEEHHIIPLSEGGLDTKDNKVNFSAREHYIAHLLLAKIYDDFKMYSAITYMQTGRIKNRQFKYNNRLYGKIREEYGIKRKGMKLSEETKRKIREAKSNMSEETRRKISEAMTGKMLGKKHWNFGKYLNADTKNKISITRKKRKCGIGNKNAVGGKGHKGLKWITNGIIEKTIPIDENPPSGFRFGRCFKKRKSV